MIYDRYDDGGKFLTEAYAGKVPDVIKTATDVSGAVAMYEDDYALALETPRGVEYKYPIVDAGNTLASAVYFAKYASHIPQDKFAEAKDKLMSAMENFDLMLGSVEKIASITLGFEDNAAEDQALLDLFGGGDDMEVLTDYFNDCSPTGRRRVMMQVKEAGVKLAAAGADAYFAEELGADLYAGLFARKDCVMPEQRAGLDAIFEKSASAPPAEIVHEIEQFDKAHHLVHLYGGLIPDPYQTVYGNTMKTASAGNVDEIRAHYEAKKEALLAAYAPDMVNQLIEDPITVFDSLPDPDKQAIEAIVKESE